FYGKLELPEYLPHFQLAVKGGLLQLDADALSNGMKIATRVESEDRHLSFVGFAQSLQDLDQCRLAGAVAPEDAEDFAALHLQVDSRERDEPVIGFGEAFDF